MCDCYSYHCSGHITKPRDTDSNIKGVELEISDCDAYDALESLIDDGILTVPYNENSSNKNIAIEEDGSVYRELIFKACSNENMIRRIKPVEEAMNSMCLANGHGTSCHIHLNNKYLRAQNIKKDEIMRATDFLYPILYRISGRNERSLRWCKSFTGFNENSFNLYERAENIDPVDSSYIYDRYDVVNLRNSTTELRIFSNYYNFDTKYIKLYLETADFIMKLAKEMDGKSYAEEFEKVLNETKEFFEQRKYKDIFERHSLNIFFASPDEQKRIQIEMKVQELKNKIEEHKERHYVDRYEEISQFIRIVRNYYRNGPNNIIFNINNPNQEEIFNSLIENYQNSLEQQ